VSTETAEEIRTLFDAMHPDEQFQVLSNLIASMREARRRVPMTGVVVLPAIEDP
jgi:hypothetical protein